LVDTFRHLFPEKHEVTWFHSCVVGGRTSFVGCRLDRVYFSSLLIKNVIDVKHAPCAQSDHDFVLCEFAINDNILIGRSYWKLNNSLLESDDLVNGFKYYFAIISKTEEITLDWWDKMKTKLRTFLLIIANIKIDKRTLIMKY